MAALKLYPYQEEGVRFLLRRPPEMNFKPHRLLADEQGLGKTPQAIVAMKVAKANVVLVICPATVKYNWARKMVEWGLCDEREIFIVRTGADRIPVVGTAGTTTRLFIIVNFDLAINPDIHRQLCVLLFDVMVVDECHKLKNFTAERSKLIIGKQLGIARRCYRKFLLSGTPVPNRPMEFFAVLKTLAPMLIQPYTKQVAFGKYFCKGYPSKFGSIDRDTGKRWNFNGASNIDELRQRIAPFMLRRELREVYQQLPPMVEEVVYLDVNINEHPQVVEQRADNRVARTEDFDAEKEMPQATIRRIIGECKVPQAVEYIKDVLETTDKLLVFAYHQNVIADLYRCLKSNNPVRLIGGMTAEQKQTAIDKFIEDPDCHIIISQITAGGVGTDGLQKVCNRIINVELDWSEGAMRQAKSRLYRIGQEKTVLVTTLIASNSMEDVMVASLERKSSVINQLIKRTNDTMSIEVELKRIADALERSNELLEQQVGGAPAGKAKPAADDADEDLPAAKNKGAAKAKAAAAKAKTIELADVKAAAQKFVDELGGTKAAAKALLKKKFKVESLADLPEAKYEAAIELFEAGPEEDDEEI